MKNASTKVVFLLYYKRDKTTCSKSAVLSKEIYLPEMNFLPSYITIENMAFSTDISSYDVDKNQIIFVNKIEYSHDELNDYKKKINFLLEKFFKLECEEGHEF